MGCCGQNRAAQKIDPLGTTTPAVTKPVSGSGPLQTTNQQAIREKATPYSVVTLYYLEISPILVRGTATGRQYNFSGAQPCQSVDKRDAETFLRTRFFRRAN